jgi:hypothetical protein
MVPTSRPTRGSGNLKRARRYLAKIPGAVQGSGGHNATFRAACVLVGRFGLDAEQALLLLSEWNRTCQPPWADWELRHKVIDALKKTSAGCQPVGTGSHS